MSINLIITSLTFILPALLMFVLVNYFFTTGTSFIRNSLGLYKPLSIAMALSIAYILTVWPIGVFMSVFTAKALLEFNVTPLPALILQKGGTLFVFSIILLERIFTKIRYKLLGS